MEEERDSSFTSSGAGRGKVVNVLHSWNVDRVVALLHALGLSNPPSDGNNFYYMDHEAYLRHVKCLSLFYGLSMVVQEEGSQPNSCVVKCRCPDCPFERRTRELVGTPDHFEGDNNHIAARQRPCLQFVTSWSEHACHPLDHLHHPLVGEEDSAFLADVLTKLVAHEEGHDRRVDGGSNYRARTDWWSLEGCTRLLALYSLNCTSPERQRELDAARRLALLWKQDKEGSTRDDDNVAEAGERQVPEQEPVQDLRKSPPSGPDFRENRNEDDPSIRVEVDEVVPAAGNVVVRASPAAGRAAVRASPVPEARASPLDAIAAAASFFGFGKGGPSRLSPWKRPPPIQEGGFDNDQRGVDPCQGVAMAAQGRDSEEDDDDDDDENHDAAMDRTSEAVEDGDLKPRARDTCRAPKGGPASEDGLDQSASDAAIPVSINPTGLVGGSQDNAASRGTSTLTDAEFDNHAAAHVEGGSPSKAPHSANNSGAEANRPLRKKLKCRIQQLNTKTGELIATFESLDMAATQTGIKRGLIRAASGQGKNTGGFRWRRCPHLEEPSRDSEQSETSTAETRSLPRPKEPAAKDNAGHVAREEGSSQLAAAVNNDDGRETASVTETASSQPRRTPRVCRAPELLDVSSSSVLQSSNHVKEGPSKALQNPDSTGTKRGTLMCSRVQQLHRKTGKVIATFESWHAAAAATGIDAERIRRAARRSGITGGYGWRLCTPPVQSLSSAQTATSTSETIKVQGPKEHAATDDATQISQDIASQARVGTKEFSNRVGAEMDNSNGSETVSLTETKPRRTQRACHAPKQLYVPASSFSEPLKPSERSKDRLPNLGDDSETGSTEGSNQVADVEEHALRGLSKTGTKKSGRPRKDNQLTRQVKQLDPETGRVIARFETIHMAAAHTKISADRIRGAASREGNSGGYGWRWCTLAETRSLEGPRELAERDDTTQIAQSSTRRVVTKETSKTRKRKNDQVASAVKSKGSSKHQHPARQKRFKSARVKIKSRGPVAGTSNGAEAEMHERLEEVDASADDSERFSSMAPKNLRVVFGDRTMQSVGSDRNETFDVVCETGPRYEAGRGPTSSSRFSTYPFMFEPSLESLKEDYQKLVDEDLCVPARLNTDSAELFEQSIDAKLASLAQFDFSEEFKTEAEADEREYKRGLREYGRAEEQERLARHKEDEAYKEQELREQAQRRGRASPALDMPVVFETDTSEPFVAEECTDPNCRVCRLKEEADPVAVDEPRKTIPMPWYQQIDSMEVIGKDYVERRASAYVLRRAQRSIAELKKMRSAIPFITTFPESALSKLRRQVRGDMSD